MGTRGWQREVLNPSSWTWGLQGKRPGPECPAGRGSGVNSLTASPSLGTVHAATKGRTLAADGETEAGSGRVQGPGGPSWG